MQALTTSGPAFATKLISFRSKSDFSIFPTLDNKAMIWRQRGAHPDSESFNTKFDFLSWWATILIKYRAAEWMLLNVAN
jgi:hypothetical protein